MNYTLLVFMLFLHIVDDYYLQGILAQMKQKSWWVDKIDNFENSMYNKDYIVALVVHGFSWSVMIMLPIIVSRGFVVDLQMFGVICLNGLLHSIVDDLKANHKKINLWQDQLIHVLQILLVFTNLG